MVRGYLNQTFKRGLNVRSLDGNGYRFKIEDLEDGTRFHGIRLDCFSYDYRVMKGDMLYFSMNHQDRIFDLQATDQHGMRKQWHVRLIFSSYDHAIVNVVLNFFAIIYSLRSFI